MLMAGKYITAKDDPLSKVKLEYLYHKIKNPGADVEAQVRHLRIVKQLDIRQYSQLKRNLPYVVCGIFNPTYRRTENFAYTEYFILDIDHITDKEISIEALRQQLQTDSRVLLCFISPGEDGLKLFFKLKERCYDPSIYSIFYKVFAAQFSKQYQIEQVIDTKTSDVSRACFISVDKDVYYNPQAELVDLSAFINVENTSELFSLNKKLDKEAKDLREEYQTAVEEPIKQGPDDESLKKIKLLLNPQIKAKLEKKEAFVPEELNVLMEKLSPYLIEAGLTILEIVNIHYGKKIKLKLNFREAEINLFFGQRGYSVVQSSRRGTNEELNQLCADLINQFLMK